MKTGKLKEVLVTPLSRVLLYSDVPPYALYHFVGRSLDTDLLIMDAKDDDSKVHGFESYVLMHPGGLVVLEMSKATQLQQTSLLKVLERDTLNYVILHSSKPLLKTIESRMQLVTSVEEEQAASLHEKLLDDRTGHNFPEKAKLPAEEVNLVTRALKALHDHDGVTLNALALKWTDVTTEALRLWCSEAISQQWRQFSPEQSEFSGVQVPLAILLAISKNVRPKLVVRAGLMGLI